MCEFCGEMSFSLLSFLKDIIKLLCATKGVLG